jgi:hypothetical protein
MSVTDREKKRTAALAPQIDFPVEGEQMQEGPYAVRISAEVGCEVEVSINNGEWQPCREAVGYWWCDWEPFGARRCKLTARARCGSGRWTKSVTRTCQITAQTD